MNLKQLIDSELSKKTFAEIDPFKLLKCYLISEKNSDFSYTNEFTDYLLSLKDDFIVKFLDFQTDKTINLENEYGDIFSIMYSPQSSAPERINIRTRTKNPFKLDLTTTKYSTNSINWCEYDKDISISRNANNRKEIKNMYSMIIYEDPTEGNLGVPFGKRTFSFRQVNKENPEVFGSEKQEIFKQIVNTIQNNKSLDEEFFELFKLTNDIYDENIKRIFLNDFQNNYFQNSHLSLLEDISKIYKDKLTLKNKNQ